MRCRRSALAAGGNKVNRGADRAGNRAEQRLDMRGNRINQGVRCARRAGQSTRSIRAPTRRKRTASITRANELDRKGNKIERKFDRKGNQIDRKV